MVAAEVLRHDIAGGLLSVALPADWELSDVEVPSVSFVAVEPDRGLVMRSNLVVTRDELEGASFEDWQRGVDALLPTVLTDYRVLDLERMEIDGCSAARRLLHHMSEESVPTTVDQVIVQVGDVGFTFVFSLPTIRYGLMAEGLQAIQYGIAVSSPSAVSS